MNYYTFQNPPYQYVNPHVNPHINPHINQQTYNPYYQQHYYHGIHSQNYHPPIVKLDSPEVSSNSIHNLVDGVQNAISAPPQVDRYYPPIIYLHEDDILEYTLEQYVYGFLIFLIFTLIVCFLCCRFPCGVRIIRKIYMIVINLIWIVLFGSIWVIEKTITLVKNLVIYLWGLMVITDANENVNVWYWGPPQKEEVTIGNTIFVPK